MPPSTEPSTASAQVRPRSRLATRPDNRQSRVRFGSRQAFLEALCRARRESWISDLRIDADALELVLEWGAPRRADLRLIQGGASRA